MSIVKEQRNSAAHPGLLEPADRSAPFHPESDTDRIQQALDCVQQAVSPVWPLKDYVAVNPYAGHSDQPFLAARHWLQSLSDLETLMPVDYYREQFAAGKLTKSDIVAAIDELVSDQVIGAEHIDVNQVITLLQEIPEPAPSADRKFAAGDYPDRTLHTFAELLDRQTNSKWSREIGDEISKHCAAHYDEGQALWASPWKSLPLYEAWRRTAQCDWQWEALGVRGFRKLVSQLPVHPQDALAELLTRLKVPTELWSDLLVCEALSMPGWSAWAKYQHRMAEQQDQDCHDLPGLLAMRLAYEVALCEQMNFEVDWDFIAAQHCQRTQPLTRPADVVMMRYALLKASEIAFRNRLFNSLACTNEPVSKDQSAQHCLAQMVFCIDVRSERIRRHLEAASNPIQTFGFAGFFGLPIEFVELGTTQGSPQVPALIAPSFKVYEEMDESDERQTGKVAGRRSLVRLLRKTWKEFQTSATSMFAFVESTGLFFGFKLLGRTLRLPHGTGSRFDGVPKADRAKLGPSLRGLNQQGITPSKQADLAEAILRGTGILNEFSRLVVFCGHGSRTENNPLQAGLDCGACCGHSGEANARLAAKLLNQAYVRQTLAKRGIAIPADTQFVAAVHNTTTDELEFFDTHLVPESHEEDLNQLENMARTATQRTNEERLSDLPGPGSADLVRRSRDWSEVRPEWGLAGNAAFIAAPRELTQSASLDARSFLHSYDHRLDPGYAVLEQIMTAPLVVAHWINMQYYASTVDPVHFGSGNKTVHNVVGRFGVLSGNGGDLMTGLPWQSVHDGREYQHHPLRLLAILAAPREAIQAILSKHESVANLLQNGWMQLIAVENGVSYRYTEQQDWIELETNATELATVAF